MDTPFFKKVPQLGLYLWYGMLGICVLSFNDLNIRPLKRSFFYDSS